MTRKEPVAAGLRIGEIAAATGMTVRTLHHYEAIGLLAPTSRTPAGHRVYGPEALARLYRSSPCRCGCGAGSPRSSSAWTTTRTPPVASCTCWRTCTCSTPSSTACASSPSGPASSPGTVMAWWSTPTSGPATASCGCTRSPPSSGWPRRRTWRATSGRS
ncbi:MAG: MerR family DNA-binding transcriptional regulator [Acidimicrobiia bacterium]|nr:MerR family DNA-binding transcriptional regulator [Acidimicrobiia bacterium]